MGRNHSYTYLNHPQQLRPEAVIDRQSQWHQLGNSSLNPISYSKWNSLHSKHNSRNSEIFIVQPTNHSICFGFSDWFVLNSQYFVCRFDVPIQTMPLFVYNAKKRWLYDTDIAIILLNSFSMETLCTEHTLYPWLNLNNSCSRATRQHVFRSSFIIAQHVGSSMDSGNGIGTIFLFNSTRNGGIFVALNMHLNVLLTRHFRQLAIFRVFNAIDQKYAKIGCHNGNTSAGIWCKYFGINDFRVFCLLTHTECVHILSKHVVNEHKSIILNAQQFFGIRPTQCQEIATIPLKMLNVCS